MWEERPLISLTHVIKTFENTLDVRQIKIQLSKHFLNHLMGSSLIQCPRHSQHQDKNQRQPNLSETAPTETVGGVSDAASALMGGLRYVSDSSDTFTILSASIYLCLWRNMLSEENQWQEQVCQGTVHERALDPVKHQGAGSQEGNYRWIPSGWKPAQMLKKKTHTHQVPAQDLRGESVHHQWLTLNSPSNIPLSNTSQWHLITSILPSASLLLHLDWLPSHRWLC